MNSDAPRTGSTPAVDPAGDRPFVDTPRYSRTQIVMAILAFSTGGFAIGVTEFAIMGLLLEATTDLGVSIPQGGQLISAYALGVVIGAPVLAVLGAKRERRRWALILLGVFVGGHVLSFFAPNYETMLAARFISGLPHGAFFGVAALMAGSMVGPTKRSKAIAVVLGGLAIANVIGVPVVTWVGQQFGWRWMFIIVIALVLFTMAAILRFAPRQMPTEGASMRAEIKGIANLRLWIGVVLAVVGFSGSFAVYSYIAPVMEDLTQINMQYLPWVVALYGVGMVVGNFVGGWAGDKSVLRTVVIAMGCLAVFMVLFATFADSVVFAMIFLFLVGAAASMLSPTMQTHLIDTAPQAPQIAASLHHSAFNAANALGAVMGAAVIDAGWGLRAPSYVGAAAAAVGVGIALYAVWLSRRAQTTSAG